MRSRMSHTAVKVIKDGKAVFAVHEWGNDGAHEPTECPKGRFMGHIFEQSPDGQVNATSLASRAPRLRQEFTPRRW